MKVLFLTHRLPYAPNRGDRIRAFHIVETLRRCTDLEVVSLAHSREEMAEVAVMNRAGIPTWARQVPRLTTYARAIPTLASSKPLTHALLSSPGLERLLDERVAVRRPDVVLAFCSGMARYALAPPLERIPRIIDLVDVDSAKWSELAERSRWPKRWIYRREARCLAAFERASAAQAHCTLVVNEREATLLQAIAPETRVEVVPNGIAFESFRPPSPPTSASRVIFCGVMNYAPNVEAVLWFAREVWPLVRRQHRQATFVVVGLDPAPAVTALASESSGIVVTGTVPSVQDYLWDSAVSVAPLKLARGIQNKVLEALAAGLPAVVTPQVWEGLPAEARQGCAVADSSGEFARHVSALLALSPMRRRDIALSANLQALAWDSRLSPLLDALGNAVRGAKT